MYEYHWGSFETVESGRVAFVPFIHIFTCSKVSVVMDLLNFLLQEQNLQIMERGLLLLKSHIESFKRRFV